MLILVTVLLANALPFAEPDKIRRRAIMFVLLAAVNAIFVHYSFAPLAPAVSQSFKPFKLLLKFTLLFFLLVAAIRSRRDFAIICMTLCLGIGYWGWEVYVNDRGTMHAGRLEGLGGPGATDANHMASAMVTILPLSGGLLFTGRLPTKIIAAAIAVLATNTILLCNSRGAMLSVIASGIVLIVTARGKLRKKAFIGVVLGSTTAFMLMGDPEIFERFKSIFVGAEERDASASSRIEFWKAGFRMLEDWPFGAGGDGFKRAGGKYMSKEQIGSGRSVHNGFINEMCEWGYQGFTLRILFIIWCCWACYKTMDYQRQPGGDENMAFFGSCTLAAMAAFLGTCMFGDYMDNEWGYWIAALCLAYSRNYGKKPPRRKRWSEILMERQEHRQQLAGQAH